MVPLIEAKMMHHYDTRWATYASDGSTRSLTLAEKVDETVHPLPRYWVSEEEVDRKLDGRWDKNWLLGWRDIARATDARTVITTLLPRQGVGHKILLGTPQRGRSEHQAFWSSFAFDYIARQKLGGTSMAYFTFMQLPMPSPDQVRSSLVPLPASAVDWIGERVDRLNARPTLSNEQQRAWWRAELDALAFHVYEVSRADVDYIMETFPIIRRQDMAEFGEYRTKRFILECYDAMAEAAATGTTYEGEVVR